MNKKCNTSLIFGILLTLAFVAGIPLIIFGAGNTSKGALYLVLLILGIVFVVMGFYGAPMVWIHYGELKRAKVVCDMISKQNFNKISLIASTLGKNQSDINKLINDYITKGYLRGFAVVDGEFIAKTDSLKAQNMTDVARLQGKAYTKKCTNCGAVLAFETDDTVVCPYCGTPNFPNSSK